MKVSKNCHKSNKPSLEYEFGKIVKIIDVHICDDIDIEKRIDEIYQMKEQRDSIIGGTKMCIKYIREKLEFLKMCESYLIPTRVLDIFNFYFGPTFAFYTHSNENLTH